MSSFQRASGFVLKWQPFLEADRLYTFFFEPEGKMVVRARGGGKGLAKLTPHLEVPGEVECLLVHGRSGVTLIGVEQKEISSRLLFSYERLFLFQSGARLVDLSLAEGESDPRITTLLREWTRLLETTPFDLTFERRGFLLAVFALKLLGFIGFDPELYRCLNCRERIQTGKFWWQSLRGGVVCHGCHEAQKEMWFSAILVSPEVIQWLRLGRSQTFEEMLRFSLPLSALDAFHAVIESLLATHFPLIPGNSLRFACLP